MSQLLLEYLPLDYDQSQILLEAANPSSTIKVKGILQRANAKNQNGRVYPKEVLLREVDRYNKQFVQERRALGECDHPESHTVNLKNVSHNIVEMHWEGDDLVGTIEILSTPSGNIVRELMKNGIKLGVSSRGMGSVKTLGENTVEVDEDFTLICFDIVSNPSTIGAFLNEGVARTEKNKENNLEILIHKFLSEIK